MAASKERSFQILDKYFSETPEEQIAKDMREYCPEFYSGIVPTMPHDDGDYEILVPDDPVEVTQMPSFRRRLIYLLFGR